MEKLNDKKRMIIFEKLNFKRLITCKNTLSDSDFIKLYSYFYQIDVAGLKNLYAHTIYDNPKKYSVDTNGYVTLISKDNRNAYKTDSRSLIVEFYSNKTFKNKVYSLKELANYKYDKKIFVVGSKPGKQIDENERYLRNKLYGNYPSLKSEVDILLDENCTEQNIEEICKLYPNIIKVLRDSLSDKKIQDDYNEFVKDYNKAIDNLNNYINLVKNNLNEEIELKNE